MHYACDNGLIDVYGRLQPDLQEVRGNALEPRVIGP